MVGEIDGPFLAGERIEQGRFADIRPPDNGDLDAFGYLFVARNRVLFTQRGRPSVTRSSRASTPVPCSGRYVGKHVGDPKGYKIVDQHFALHGVDLADGER